MDSAIGTKSPRARSALGAARKRKVGAITVTAVAMIVPLFELSAFAAAGLGALLTLTLYNTLECHDLSKRLDTALDLLAQAHKESA